MLGATLTLARHLSWSTKSRERQSGLIFRIEEKPQKKISSIDLHWKNFLSTIPQADSPGDSEPLALVTLRSELKEGFSFRPDSA